MAEVVLASASERIQWSNKYLREYVRDTGLMPYMGTAANSIIRVSNELANNAGTAINFPLVGRLKGRGVQDAEVLEGNEEDLENLNDQVTVRWRRNGVVVPKSTSYRTEINLLDAGRDALVDWAAERTRDRLYEEMGSIIVPGAADSNGIPGTDTSVPYVLSTATQRNTFLTNNVDRVLFGVSKSNTVAGNWASSLANVDNTADKLTTGIISLAKRMARTPGLLQRKIRPYRVDGGSEYFVMFAQSLPFRDLKNDPVMQQANRDARVRGVETNPIFQDGDLMWDGVIIRELPELPVITGAGAGGIDVAQSFLCGASALMVANGQTPTPKSDPTRDYSFRPGVAIEELTGQKKVSYGGQQYGIVTVVTAAVGDA